MVISDRAIAAADVPWVPLSDGAEYKPVRFDFATGVWVNVLRIAPGAGLSRHRHNGGAVLAYCLEGSWRYLEREWVAVPGTFVYEPPGDVHTLEAGPEGMTTLFVTDGVLQYFDESEGVVREDTVFTRYEGYLRHCEANGIPLVDLVY
jgi:2,4'-dihydroxyacetophenone dioxygenase